MLYAFCFIGMLCRRFDGVVSHTMNWTYQLTDYGGIQGVVSVGGKSEPNSGMGCKLQPASLTAVHPHGIATVLQHNTTNWRHIREQRLNNPLGKVWSNQWSCSNNPYQFATTVAYCNWPKLWQHKVTFMICTSNNLNRRNLGEDFCRALNRESACSAKN